MLKFKVNKNLSMKKLIIILLFPIILSAENKAEMIYKFFAKTEYKKVANIITAMAVLETGWFVSMQHNKRHNYFSLKGNLAPECDRPICKLKTFKSDKEGLQEQLKFFRRRGYSTEKKLFIIDLQSKKYAEDKNYIKKVLQISRRIR